MKLPKAFVQDLFGGRSHDLDLREFYRLLHDLFSIPNRWRNNLYIDIPFCEQRCKYCCYFRGLPSKRRQVSTFYKRVLLPQLDQFKDVLKKNSFYQLQFGGGTPTLLSAHELERIFQHIPAIDRIPVKIIEVSPQSLTDEHIALFGKYEFTTISLGVQTFSGETLKRQNRPPVDKRRLRYFCREIERHGMISNIDLILFLDGGSKGDLLRGRRDLEYALSVLRPVEIAIHSKYGVVSGNKKLSAPLTRLVKEMLKKYPEYICVNSLLEKRDMEGDPCLRLMRDRFDYLMSFQTAQVHPANYGYNTLALGGLEDASPLYSSYHQYLILHNRCHAARVVNWDWSSSRYRDFTRVRKELGLPYYRVKKDGFFVRRSDRNKSESIMARLQFLSVVDKYLYQKLLDRHDYVITDIIKVSGSCYEIEFGNKKAPQDVFSVYISSTRTPGNGWRTASGRYIHMEREGVSKGHLAFIEDLIQQI